MSSVIILNLVFGKRKSSRDNYSAIIAVQSLGPSGFWRFSEITESESLVRQIQKISLWSELAHKGCGVSAEDKELADFCILEGGFELALFSTPKGFAIEAREDDRCLHLRRHTRIWVSPSEIVKFVNTMFACISGERTGLSIGEFDDFMDRDPESIPMIGMFRDGLGDLQRRPLQKVSVDITLDDLHFVRDTLQELSKRLISVDSWSEVSTETYWCPSGSLRIDAHIVTDTEFLTRYLDLTVGTSMHGALWTVSMERFEVEQSVNSFAQDCESIVLYGRHIPASPM